MLQSAGTLRTIHICGRAERVPEAEQAAQCDGWWNGGRAYRGAGLTPSSLNRLASVAFEPLVLGEHHCCDLRL